MIRCFTLFIACLFGLTLPTSTVFAQTVDGDMISTKLAERCGLERAWFTQAQVSPARGRIIDLQLHISSTQSLTVYEVVLPDGGKRIFSQRDIDTFGDEIGIEAAQKKAAEYAEQLKRGGAEAELAEKVIPEITLYATSNLGLIHAIDGRTGKTRWKAAIGNSGFPTVIPAISDQYIAMGNGSTIYLLEASNGHLMWRSNGDSSPMVGGVFADGVLFVPMLNGHVDAYRIQPEAPKWPKVYYSRGTVQFPPTAVGKSVVWASDAGDISVATAGVDGLRFRLVLETPVAGRVAVNPPRTLFAAGEGGSVFSFDLADGTVNWQLPTGQAIVRGPVYVDNTLYVTTKRHGMHAVDADTGDLRWSTSSDAIGFAAVAGGSVYATTKDQHLVSYDADKGYQQARVGLGLSDLTLANSKTDWIYVATQRGLVYCLRPRGADWPTIFHGQSKPAATESGAQTGAEPADPGAPATKPATEETPKDPFGGAADPFGVEPSADPPVADGGMQGSEPPDGGDPFK